MISRAAYGDVVALLAYFIPLSALLCCIYISVLMVVCCLWWIPPPLFSCYIGDIFLLCEWLDWHFLISDWNGYGNIIAMVAG